MFVLASGYFQYFFDRNEIQKILILCPQGIGDSLMAMSMIDVLKNSIREVQISVLVRNNNISEMLKRAKIVDKVHLLESSSLKNFIKITNEIYKYHYNVSITTSNVNQFKGSFFPFICGIKLRLGDLKNKKMHFYNRYIKYNGRILKIKQNLKILSLLNLNIDKFRPPKFIIYEREQEEVINFLRAQKVNKHFLIGIVPSSNSRGAGPTRRWAPEKFAKLCDTLIETGKIPVFLGNREDKTTVISKIVSLMKYPEEALDTSGKFTLFQTGALIKNCRTVIGNDAGLMHIAAALEVPTITIFGHTNRYAHRPYQKKSYIVYNKNLECSPCVDINPYGACKEKKCLKDISVQDVLLKLDEELQ
ncbi:MAG: lipopolysaccharide heptosyltransferase II [Candidatus Hodarchaeota archaeon]